MYVETITTLVIDRVLGDICGQLLRHFVRIVQMRPPGNMYVSGGNDIDFVYANCCSQVLLLKYLGAVFFFCKARVRCVCV